MKEYSLTEDMTTKDGRTYEQWLDEWRLHVWRLPVNRRIQNALLNHVKAKSLPWNPVLLGLVDDDGYLVPFPEWVKGALDFPHPDKGVNPRLWVRHLGKKSDRELYAALDSLSPTR